MDWLRWIGHRPSHSATASDEVVPSPVERATPGVAALFDGVPEDGSHTVLDLGPATPSTLQVYARFAQHMRFADLLADTPGQRGWGKRLDALLPSPERPYDLVFAWDVLDRILPEERLLLVKRLAEITAENARLYIVAEASERTRTYPCRFTLLDVDRMRYEPVGPARLAGRPLLPADVVRLLVPFQVVHAFTLKSGLREYMATKRSVA